MMTEVYKIINKIGPTYNHSMFIQPKINYNHRKALPLLQTKWKTKRYGFYSFKYQGAKLWNNLSNNYKYASSLNGFKHELLQWDLICGCNNCLLCTLAEM